MSNRKVAILVLLDLILVFVLVNLCFPNSPKEGIGDCSAPVIKEQLRAEKDRIVKEEIKKKKEAERKAKEDAERKAKEEQKNQQSSGYVSASDFRVQGVIYANGVKYTWYSEKVLPGGGLNIPGRHVNGDGYVCDGDGYICVASCDYAQGTVLSTPFGPAKVYDVCPTSGIVDVYVSW